MPKIAVRPSILNSDQTISIPLSKNHFAIVDEIDADLSDFHWSALITHTKVYAYRTAKIDDKHTTVLMHRVILARALNVDLSKYDLVDHIDLNGINNRRNNLRIATHSQNLQNKSIQSNNQLGYKGVTLVRGKYQNKFKAQIQFDGKLFYLGIHDTVEEAYAVYCEKAKELFGEFARFE